MKGLVCGETASNVGVVICDTNHRCLYELRKSWSLDAGYRGIEVDVMELEALMEALEVAVKLGIKRVNIYCDNNSVYQYVSFYFNVSSYVDYVITIFSLPLTKTALPTLPSFQMYTLALQFNKNHS